MSKTPPTINQICTSSLKGFRKTIEVAQVQIQKQYQGQWQGRSPASQDYPQGLRKWMNWGVKRLQEVQLQIEGIEAETEAAGLREELNQLANDLVIFYGYAEDRSPLEMIKILDRILLRASEARRLACLSSLAES